MLLDNNVAIKARDTSGNIRYVFWPQSGNIVEFNPLADASGWQFISIDRTTNYFHIKSTGIESYIDHKIKRIKASLGTALVAGDFGTPSAGCGSTASISAVAANSRDQTFEFSLTSAGTGQSANGCAVTFTFKDGTFGNAPFLTCQRNDTLATAGRIAHTTLSATAPVLTFIGTPVGAEVYKIACNFLGN
jgi:hypothetical protein